MQCTHPDHNDNETCEDRAVACDSQCTCCIVVPDCKCGNTGQLYHPCPGKVEMGDDDGSICNCCESCEAFCLECT